MKRGNLLLLVCVWESLVCVLFFVLFICNIFCSFIAFYRRKNIWNLACAAYWFWQHHSFALSLDENKSSLFFKFSKIFNSNYNNESTNNTIATLSNICIILFFLICKNRFCFCFGSFVEKRKIFVKLFSSLYFVNY
jgi:hypothetical protein